ncbi:uncharacterized protein LOC128964037 [Oppia nitens]|uniref:uncharacterized protein LOC128964037 n=1 Tax=Oppia nitens TaxID=1686743 RepID=UPI0023DCCA02|nr:uncharacterized protein LOC128964037 [Oppia nitens]
MAASTIIIPLTTQLWQIYTCAFIFGLGTGVWLAAYYTWIIEIWQSRSGPLVFLSQLMYGIGFVFGPILDKPFLTGDINDRRNETQMDRSIVMIDIEKRKSKLMVPFIVSGGLQALFPLLLIIMFIIKPYEKPKQEIIESTANSNTNNNGSVIKPMDGKKWTKYATIILMTISLSSLNTLEIVYFGLGPTYFQYVPAGLGAPTAAAIVSVMTACYTIGQAFNFFITMTVKPIYIISYHYVIAFIVIICLIFVQNSEIGLWIMSAAIGLAISALFPGHMTFFEKYINITDKVSTFMWCICGVINTIAALIFTLGVSVYKPYDREIEPIHQIQELYLISKYKSSSFEPIVGTVNEDKQIVINKTNDAFNNTFLLSSLL